MNVRIVPILIAVIFGIGFGVAGYSASLNQPETAATCTECVQCKTLVEKVEALQEEDAGEDQEFSKYELELLARTSRLLIIQEQIAMMLLQERGEIPYKKMLATEEEIAAAAEKEAKVDSE